jgi:simple sugar transport system substrate-binding protein
MKAMIAVSLISLALLGATGCSSGGNLPQIEHLIGVSQANMREPWRLELARELKEEAAKYPEIRLVFTDATQDSEKQLQDITRLMEYGIDLLIISPSDVEALTPAISEVYSKIPVIVLDRVVEGYDYTLFIGPDNEVIGKQAGEAISKLAKSSDFKILELRGVDNYLSSEARSSGLMGVTSKHENISSKVITVPNDSRDAAEDAVSALGAGVGSYDLIFAYNDYLAQGAYRAVKGLPKRPFIIGVDGFTGADGGLEMIRKEMIDETITCPTGGREAIRYSLDILRKASGVPKKVILRSYAVNSENLESYERSLEKSGTPHTGPIRVGYAQAGTESGFRLANNNSIIAAAKEFGIDLTVIDANQVAESQVDAVRTFVDMKVDVIVISPIIEVGWSEVLTSAKEAGIEVILSDRRIRGDQNDLYLTFIGADFIEEGRRAMKWVAENVPADKRTVRILEIQGTQEASPTIDRKRGFELALAETKGYEIVYSGHGEYTRESGRLFMEWYLKENNWDIDVLFCHNDDMALGAAQALEAAGISPGIDVKIVSVDGTKEALDALKDERLNCVVECSPLLGSQLMKAIKDLMEGKELPFRS